ncbi:MULTISPECIES: hypothetical protein [Pseudoalteromonas]|uniref:Beta-hydroxyacyl-ACP dehydratase n=1 Tax=Pseudoalteromonas amylolytica TaxID=1859457 RepID=A0A1S1MVB8_9GAMM|nr:MULTISPECIES: hypothetical protein [Pseudoalteromonas]MCF6436501.1 hypothetical protein [Pseudoalteromonas sp. MMG022]OHU86151.1 hypothetical protein BFC16_15690 [Pseudoalteromonas sp. JW3]OHU89742.1 hypothetical protein BET10_16625 [Pseudoalteromonas amylolytica]
MSDYSFEYIVKELSGHGKGPISHTGVKQYLRHTHPMLGLDQVADHDFEKGWVHSLRAISCSIPAFEGHFPDAAIYPGTNLAQDTIQVAIMLFLGMTRPLIPDGSNEEVSAVADLSLTMGHPVPPGTLLDVALWATGKTTDSQMPFEFEVRVRDFPYYDQGNKFGVTFGPALKGSGKMIRVKKKIYHGIGF